MCQAHQPGFLIFLHQDHLVYSELGWTGLQLYSHDRQLSQVCMAHVLVRYSMNQC